MVSYRWQESPMVPSVRHNGEQMIKLVSDDQFLHGQKIFLPFIWEITLTIENLMNW